MREPEGSAMVSQWESLWIIVLLGKFAAPMYPDEYNIFYRISRCWLD